MTNPTAMRKLAGRAALALLALGGLAVSAGIAQAANPADLPTARVSFADLDLSTDAGARTLYRRIQGAADKVCPNVDLRDLTRSVEARNCRLNAIERAVQAVGSPKLAAVSLAATRRG